MYEWVCAVVCFFGRSFVCSFVHSFTRLHSMRCDVLFVVYVCYIVVVVAIIFLLSFQFTVIKALTVCCCLFTFVELWMHACVCVRHFFFLFSLASLFFRSVCLCFCFEPNISNALLITICYIFASSNTYTVLIIFNVLNGISTIIRIYTFVYWLMFYTLYMYGFLFSTILYVECIVSGAK